LALSGSECPEFAVVPNPETTVLGDTPGIKTVPEKVIAGIERPAGEDTR